MPSGTYSIQILTGANLSASRNLIITDAGIVQAVANATDSIGALEANASTALANEAVFVTFEGTATCVAGGAAVTPFALVMVDAANPGAVIDATAGNVAIGRYIPELIDGALPPATVLGQEITCYIFGSKALTI